MARGALEGLRVVEFGGRPGAAYAGKLLADLGADVIKVEPLEGDPARRHGPFPGDRPDPEASGLFLFANANKRSVAVDGARPAGRAIVLDLVERADALVAGGMPAELEAAGLRWADLEARNPRLVAAVVTPYGLTGPYRDRPAHDINVAAAGGVSLGIGAPDREPLKLPYDQTGFQAGLVAAFAVLASVLGRTRTGRGRLNDISEAEVWATIHTGPGVVAWLFSGRLRRRSGHRLLGLPWPHTVLPCRDGYFALQASERRHWEAFVEMIGSPEWTRDPKYRDRVRANEEHGDELDAHLAPWLAARTRAEIFELTRRYRIAGAPLLAMDEVVGHEHLAARGFWAEVSHPRAGRLRYPGAPYRLGRTPWSLRRAAPLLGEHTREVLREVLDVDDARWDALAADGVVRP
ncbi:MAG TPA: CoA transferase [Thermodesulfobacteriota bacterium]